MEGIGESRSAVSVSCIGYAASTGHERIGPAMSAAGFPGKPGGHMSTGEESPLARGRHVDVTCAGAVDRLDTTVVASSPITAGARSRQMITGISLQRLLLSPTPVFCIIKVSAPDGVLQLDAHPRADVCTWANLVKVATDCQEQNVCVRRAERTGCFVLETVRHLSAGEEMRVWFSAPLAAELHVPFLSPTNIQGNQAYVCHVCGVSFTTPNTLKVHLMLECRPLCPSFATPLHSPPSKKPHPLAVHNLPAAVCSIVNSASSTSSKANAPIETKPFPLALKPHPSSHGVPTAVENGSPMHCASMPTSDPRKIAEQSSPSLGIPRLPSLRVLDATEQSPSAFCRPYHSASTFDLLHRMARSINPDGNSIRKPRGHVCLLCGKVYSRKYGLKIHLRTHTGHKPLRCKHCARPFSDPSNLNKHVRLHAEADSPYRCQHCRKVLVRRRDLERHVRSRHSAQNEDGIPPT